MPKLTLNNIGSFSQDAITTINQNNSRLEAAIDTLLSRNGDLPNQMESDLDLNHNDLLNVKEIDVQKISFGTSEINTIDLINSVSAVGDLDEYVDAAQGYANQAQQFRNGAEDYSSLSRAWAEGTVPGGPGTFSSREWASIAEDNIQDAIDAADRAEDAEEAAEIAAMVAAGAMTTLIDPQFDTHAQVLAFTPNNPAPSFIRTSGYTTPGDGGGILWEKVNSSAGTFGITLTDVNSNPVYYRRALQVTTPYQFGAIGTSEVPPSSSAPDDTVALQAFFDYCSNNQTLLAVFRGNFKTTNELSITGGATKHYLCAAYLRPLFPTGNRHKACLRIDASNLTFSGRIDMHGNSATWSDRTCGNGLVINGSHTTIQSVQAINMVRWGVKVENGSTGTNINKMRSERCGSGSTYPLYNKTINVLSFENFGAPTSPNRYSIVTVDEVPDHIENNAAVLNIDSSPYLVESFDSEAKTMRIFPQLPAGYTPNQVDVIAGGALEVLGSDSSNLNITMFSALSCGIAHRAGALYPPQITCASTQSCGIGLLIGSSKSAGCLSGGITNFYAEAMRYPIVMATRQVSYVITNSLMAESSKKDCRTLDNQSVAFTGLDVRLEPERARRSQTGTTSNISLGPTELAIENISRDTKTVTLVAEDGLYPRLYSRDEVWIIAHGTTARNPTGAWIIQGEAGYTVNNMASVTVNNWSAGTNILRAKLVGTNWELVRWSAAETMSLSLTYNWADLLAGAIQSTTVTINGAVVGDFVDVSMNIPLLGTRLWGEVTAANTITIYHHNLTSAAVNLNSGTMIVRVSKST